MTTTIKLDEGTKKRLDTYREHVQESYDDVVQKLLYIADNAGTELAEETVQQIEAARERLQDGDFVTEEEARQRLGLD